MNCTLTMEEINDATYAIMLEACDGSHEKVEELFKAIIDSFNDRHFPEETTKDE